MLGTNPLQILRQAQSGPGADATVRGGGSWLSYPLLTGTTHPPRSEPYPPQLCQAIARVADHVGGRRRRGPELAWPRRQIIIDGRLVLKEPVANARGAAAAAAEA